MNSAVKRYLFMGLTLSIMALTEIRNKLEAAGADGNLEPVTPNQKPGTKNIDPSADKASHVFPEPKAVPISATTVTFSGTVERNGGRFVLRETGGTLYTLDSTGRAWPFEGEDVRVTGKLDTSARVLRIDSIELMADSVLPAVVSAKGEGALRPPVIAGSGSLSRRVV